MPQIFHHSTNFLARLSIFGAIFIILALLWVLAEINRSSWNTGAFVERQQPVQFSHRHHVGDDGIDCRYCHTSVETSSFAGIPSSQICMNCHSQIWADSPYLEPVRESARTGKPIEWTRVNDLPDYVYFNHSIHVNKGVGCSTCHGQVDQMSLTYQAASLQMEWCIECHRNPKPILREKKDIYRMDWRAPANQAEVGARLFAQNKIQDAYALTSCSTCHR
ncbi:MAG: cytochrome c family protein [Acidobacteriota bacterium]|nr:cytochrome c family protein [Acidobacteriota bacterium]